jgi:hypothetical protein
MKSIITIVLFCELVLVFELCSMILKLPALHWYQVGIWIQCNFTQTLWCNTGATSWKRWQPFYHMVAVCLSYISNGAHNPNSSSLCQCFNEWWVLHEVNNLWWLSDKRIGFPSNQKQCKANLYSIYLYGKSILQISCESDFHIVLCEWFKRFINNANGEMCCFRRHGYKFSTLLV